MDVLDIRSVDHGRVVRNVIVIRDRGDVGDMGVGDVHLLEVSAACVIGGDVRLSPPERKPGHATAATEGNTYAHVRTSDPRHQRRCVNRPCYNDRSWCPCPVAAGIHPASVVRGRKSPRRIIDPGPTPGFNPNPVPVMIRGPARGHSRHPNGSVGAGSAPGAVLVEVVGSDHVGRHVFIGSCVIFALVAHPAPIVEAIKTRRAGHLVLH